MYKRSLLIFFFLTFSFALVAADAIQGDVAKQPLNLTAISMFLAFVAATLGITYWAAKKTKSTKDFYAAGGSITGLQNGLAIAGDYMSAASFLGISGLVFASGFDGLIYSIGFLVGWPIILFLLAERLRNLGKFTFADAVSYRLQAVPIRSLAACGTMAVVILYLIAQMVGAGKLIQILFGLGISLRGYGRRGVDDYVCHIWRHAWQLPGYKSSRPYFYYRVPASWQSL